MPRSPAVRTSLAFVAVALVSLVFADLAISTLEPWQELRRLVVGAVTPNFRSMHDVSMALLQTLAFAIIGVAVGAGAGFGLSMLFHHRTVRVACAFVRAIHELFWALIFLQIFGLHPLTGLLAIALPYAGTFAKVYSEILEEADRAPVLALPAGTGRVSAFFFARLPDVWAHVRTYTLYRLECGLRSSAVLGFVGVPTLGFYLQSAYMEGHYSDVSALLILFYLLIATMRIWMRARLLPLYIVAALFFVAGEAPLSMDNVVRFFTQDIVPQPLRSGAGFEGLASWLGDLLMDQALPGMISTIILTQIALVLTGIAALVFFPLISKKFFGPVGRNIGHGLLVIIRSTPEYILAFVFLQLWGPSMLPAIIALVLHNGAIVGHLIGRYSDELKLRADAPRGLSLYAYEVTPRVYGQFLAFLFYRWEIIMRETGILGLLGIATLGFYVDSAIQDIRMDRAMVLILVTALLNIGIDAASRRLRARLHLRTTPECG